MSEDSVRGTLQEKYFVRRQRERDIAGKGQVLFPHFRVRGLLLFTSIALSVVCMHAHVHECPVVLCPSTQAALAQAGDHPAAVGTLLFSPSLTWAAVP